MPAKFGFALTLCKRRRLSSRFMIIKSLYIYDRDKPLRPEYLCPKVRFFNFYKCYQFSGLNEDYAQVKPGQKWQSNADVTCRCEVISNEESVISYYYIRDPTKSTYTLHDKTFYGRWTLCSVDDV